MQHFPIPVVKCEIYHFNYEVENYEQIYKFIGYQTKELETNFAVSRISGVENIIELQFLDDSKCLQKLLS